MLRIELILIMSVKPHTVFLIPTDSDSDGLQYDCECKVLFKISEATNTLSNTSENLVLKGTILQPMMFV